MKKALAVRTLTSVGWLSRQPRSFQTDFLRLGQLVTFDADEYLFHVDDPEGGVFGIVDGGIAALVPMIRGEPRLATILRTGVWFGYGPLLTGQRRTLAFRASEPSVLMRIDFAAVNELRARDPSISRHLAILSEQGTDVAIQVIGDLLITDTDRRIAATLLRVADARDNPANGKMRKIRLNQTELAEMANTSRHTANRTLGSFEEAGLIAVSYRHIQLRDPIALAEFAYGGGE